MKYTDLELKEIINSRPEIRGLTRAINDRMILDGFSNEQTLVIASYIWDFLDTGGLGSWEEFKEFQNLFRYLGGDLSEYYGVCDEAKIRGWVGLTDYAPERMPYLSSSKGIEVFEELLGKDLGRATRIFRADQPYLARTKFKQFIETNILPTKKLYIADSYVNSGTLEFLVPLFGNINSLRILTKEIDEDNDAFKKDLEKFQSESKFKIEVRKTSKLHDRFLISESSSWTVGGSIKELGKKSDIILSDISIIYDSVVQLFRERWNESNIFWSH